MIKSMPVFFIDNQQLWPKGAELHGNMVLWPDGGKYPGMAGIAIASHPEFEGKIVAQAGNRTILITFVPDANTQAEIRAKMSAKEPLEQYRVAVDGLVHAIMLKRANAEGGGDCHPLELLTMLAKTSPLDAAILVQALKKWLRDPTPGAPNDANTQAAMVQSAEEMVGALKGSA